MWCGLQPEFWIVNLADCQLEVYRNPNGAEYLEMTVYRAGQTVEPLFTPGKSIAVDEMLP